MRTQTFTTFSLITLFVTIGTALVISSGPSHKNLQVLPKDISAFKLDSIMQTYNAALGVNCKFCHVAFKQFPDSLDYASDAEPMKDQARKMMRMNIHINKTWFYFDSTERPEYLKTVTCNTCHKGEPFPEQ